jgi:hypothetical protein
LKIEHEYDKLLTALTKGIIDNYGNDEYNMVLDVMKLKRGYESIFESILRERQKKV